MNGATIDETYVEWPTIALFVICSIITLFAVNEDCKRSTVTQTDLRQTADSAQASLEQEFDRKYSGN
jgi:hypothetical protein